MGTISKDEEGMINAFEAATKLLSSKDIKAMPYYRRNKLFFVDYDLIPLLIQENYLTAYSSRDDIESMYKVSTAADYISMGDIVNKKIRQETEWSLLPDLGFMSTVAPCSLSNGYVPFTKFPLWFGKFSSTKKKQRLLLELRQTLSATAPISANASCMINEIIPVIFKQIMRALEGGEESDIIKAIEVMGHHNISIDQLKENIFELLGSDKVASFNNLDPKVKAQFTKDYNKIYNTKLIAKKTKKTEKETKTLNPDEEHSEIESSNSSENENKKSDDSDWDMKNKKKKAKAKTKSKKSKQA